MMRYGCDTAILRRICRIDQYTKGGYLLQCSTTKNQEDCKVRKNRQGRQDRQGKKWKNRCFYRLLLCLSWRPWRTWRFKKSTLQFSCLHFAYYWTKCRGFATIEGLAEAVGLEPRYHPTFFVPRRVLAIWGPSAR